MEASVVGGIVGGLSAVILTLLLWLARKEQPVQQGGSTLRFRHQGVLRILAATVAFGIPVGLTVLVILNPPTNAKDIQAIVVLYLLFGGLLFPLWWEAQWFRLILNNEGVECRSPWRGKRFLPWEEVRSLSYSGLNSWFILHAADGYRFRVPLHVSDLNRFLQRMEEQLPASALTEAAMGYARLGRRVPVVRKSGVDLSNWGVTPDWQEPRPGSHGRGEEGRTHKKPEE